MALKMTRLYFVWSNFGIPSTIQLCFLLRVWENGVQLLCGIVFVMCNLLTLRADPTGAERCL